MGVKMLFTRKINRLIRAALLCIVCASVFLLVKGRLSQPVTADDDGRPGASVVYAWETGKHSDKSAAINGTGSVPPDSMSEIRAAGDPEPVKIWSWHEASPADVAAIEKAERLLQVPVGSSFSVAMNREFLAGLTANSVVPLPLPGIGDKYEMYVSRIDKRNGEATIIGHINGYDIGYGVTITYGPDWTYGSILTPEGRFNIETLNGATLMLNNMKTISGPGMQDEMPVRPETPATNL